MDPKLKERYNSLSTSINSTPEQRSGNQMPTYAEIQKEKQLKKNIDQLQGIKDKNLAERWYGKPNDETRKDDTAPAPKGMLQRGINALTAPLYAGIGALDYATGQSRANSLTDAINKNVNEDRRLWGDVIKGTGLPGVVAKPLGLTLDIVTDPVNILTAGTGGILARMLIGGSKGYAKAGLTGAAKGVRYGAESRALETALVAKALTLGGADLGMKVASSLNPMRFVRKVKGTATAADDMIATTTKEASLKLRGGISKRLETATKNYNEIVGSTAIKRAIEDRTITGYFYNGLKEAAKKVGDKNPAVKDFFEKYLIYDNEKWTRIAQIKDALLKHSSEADVNAASKAFIKVNKEGGSLEEAMDAAKLNFSQMPKVKDFPDAPSVDSPFEDPENFIYTPKEELDKAMSAISYTDTVSPDDVMAVQEVFDDGMEALNVMKDPDTYISSDSFENQFRLVQEATENGDAYDRFAGMLEQMVKSGEASQTGVAWFDNARAKINSFKQIVKDKKSQTNPNITIKERVGEKTAQFLDVYDTMMVFFKKGKVAASLRAWTNAVFGNLAMAKLNGIDVLDPTYMKSFKQGFNVVTGKTSADLLLNDLAEVSDLIPMLRSNPTLFTSTTGISANQIEEISQLKDLVGRFKKIGVDGGVLQPTATNNEVLDAMEGLIRESAEATNTTEGAMSALAKTWATKSKSGVKTLNERMVDSVDEVTGAVSVAPGTDLASNEYFVSEQANRISKWFATKSKEEGNYAAKLGNLIYNKMPDGYGKIDHVYKLSNIIYTSKYGVKEHELRQIARAIDLSGTGDVEEIIVDGMSRFKLSAVKSAELANDTFLNYNAMPAAVKLIRQMPLVGAPFIAFTYGMYGKIMKGLIRNPAFFTKQSYALEEMSADESAVEKGLLAMDKYKYLDDPAMLKVPFPGNNLVYVNAANVLPYLSLSLLQPGSRSFEEVLPNSVVQLVDKSPLLKDPVGSMIFDYFLLPALLSEEIPLGSFGQPVYPTDPTLAERVKYPVRSLADSFVPGLAELGMGTLAPTSMAEGLPGYLTRKMLYAKEGKTPLGIQAKENPVSRFSRAFFSGLGVPIQTPIPHTFLQEKEISDQLNK